MNLPFEGLERFYEALAQAIDQVDLRERELFLTRLALVLAHELDDADRGLAAIRSSLAASNGNIECA